MKNKIIASAILTLAGQTLALAAACSDTRCSGEISVLYVTASGDAYLGLVGGLAGLTGCTPNDGVQQYLTISASSPNMKLIYATLLAAQMAGRSISVAADANSIGCTIRYVTSP
jgi:hypothetical protein